MVDIIKDANKELEVHRKLKNLKGESLRHQLIETTKGYALNLDDYDDLLINEVPLTQAEVYVSKKNDAISLWNDIISITKLKAKTDINDAIILPSNIKHLLQVLQKLSEKEIFEEDEIYELFGTYKIVFESIVKLFTPHFRIIFNKDGFIDWSEISNKIREFEKKYKKLFSCMNGEFKNAESHASIYVEKNLLLWIKEDGSRQPYTGDELMDKLIEIFALFVALYWAFSETYYKALLHVYETMPLDKLEYGYSKVNLPSFKVDNK